MVSFTVYYIFKHDNNSGFDNKAKEKWANEQNDPLMCTKFNEICTKVDKITHNKWRTSLKFTNPGKVINRQKSAKNSFISRISGNIEKSLTNLY